MSDSMPYADLIILALIAGFVLLRLRSVLGQNIGRPPGLSKDVLDLQPDEPVVQLTDRNSPRAAEVKNPDEALLAAITDPSIRDGIADIKAADPAFTLRNFLEGARGAFEMVFDAFSKGEKPALQMLLSPALYESFAQAYDAKQKEEHKRETTLVSIESETLTAAALTGTTARLAVRFISEQVSVTRDKTGAIIEGDPSRTERVQDEWVFERDTTARNPNWKIIDT